MAEFLPPFLSCYYPFSPSNSSSSKSLHVRSRLLAASPALGLRHLLRVPRERFCLLFCSAFQDDHHSHYVSKCPWKLNGNQFGDCFTLEPLVEAWLSIPTSWLSFFGKNKSEKSNGKYGTSPGHSSNGRHWTNFLLAVNILVYIAQVATNGNLLLWGAKVNDLINQGQTWRLVTSSFLHANIIHLMANCYSLNSVGPTAEKICGPKRFLAIYLGSAIACSTMSYYLCQSDAVGASGAIFGLVASYAMFLMRHRELIRTGKNELADVFKVIAVNMAIGFSIKSIDNWGHLGGLLGGTAISWFVGPLWRYDVRPEDGKPVVKDKAPIFYFNKGPN